MRSVLRSRRALWLLLSIAIIGGLALAGELRTDRAGAQQPLVESIDVPEGPSLVGWLGLPQDSAEILAATPNLDLIWWLDPVTDAWRVDARTLPDALRNPILFTRGDGLLVIASRAATIHMPLRAPSLIACPPNPDPADPSAIPTITVQAPTAGTLVTSPLRITGRAATFEANVQARLIADGAEVAFTFGQAQEAFVLSPYALDLPYAIAAPVEGCLEVFTTSARDGSPILIAQVPLILVP